MSDTCGWCGQKRHYGHNRLCPVKEIEAWSVENERLRTALQDVVRDILEYERINNLAPNPGRKYCWDSVERAVHVLNADGASPQ
jgi:hypothetical protein